MSVAVDPILQKVLHAFPIQLTTDGGPQAARARSREIPVRDAHPEVTAHDRTIDGPAGPIPVRIYRPPAVPEPAPAVVFLHGGGWSVGDLDSYDAVARRHAAGAHAVVVSVDYRLAPEHPFPAAVDDSWAATRWVAGHADDLGVDPNRLAVAGDSAGGNLAAVVAQLAREASGPRLAFQLLWYPPTTFDTSMPSFTENAEAPVLTTAGCKGYSRWYITGLDLSVIPPTLAPARAADFSGLPPAYIGVAGHDPLRDDGIRYGQLLRGAGVPVEVHNAAALVHAFLFFDQVVPAATEATDRGLRALRTALHGPGLR
ncbi:MAG: alpha/beta hydrolase [Mycolicibacterium hassiacum]|uniref:alpha/beta hydrolase n=1 Tax=Mycolicibacterium hassiacum TaxID=46351 RepID=UPI0023F72763|nr:alpha/beta hydrolase [Mycolicibacterium hassiacum]MBX5487596.1 alpha/beta hydrolase [Mycolicibacterium hassiacum]